MIPEYKLTDDEILAVPVSWDNFRGVADAATKKARKATLEEVREIIQAKKKAYDSLSIIYEYVVGKIEMCDELLGAIEELGEKNIND